MSQPKTFEQILEENHCDAKLLENVLTADGIHLNGYERLLKAVKEFSDQQVDHYQGLWKQGVIIIEQLNSQIEILEAQMSGYKQGVEFLNLETVSEAADSYLLSIKHEDEGIPRHVTDDFIAGARWNQQRANSLQIKINMLEQSKDECMVLLEKAFVSANEKIASEIYEFIRNERSK